MTDQQTSRTNITEALRLPWHRETVGHADIWQIAAKNAADLAVPLGEGLPPNTDATWIVNADNRIVAFVGNGPRQTHNADAIIAAVEALAAEPRSDAVTAPDEPSHEHEWGLCYGGLSPEAAAEHGIKPHWFCTDCMFGDEPPVEARAASASVPPLDVERLAKELEDHQAEDGKGFRHTCMADCADEIAAVYAAETPEEKP